MNPGWLDTNFDHQQELSKNSVNLHTHTHMMHIITEHTQQTNTYVRITRVGLILFELDLNKDNIFKSKKRELRFQAHKSISRKRHSTTHHHRQVIF